MPKLPLAHALLNALKAYGAREIFGIPGDFALPFFKEIERTSILPLHTLSHEPAVGFAADAAARYRSTLGVAAVTYGAGALNMVNATALAYAEKSPVVVVSAAPGAAEGQIGLGLHHQVKHLASQYLVYREVTCAQAILDDAASAPAKIARVLTAARELSRPVYLELPRDMVTTEVDPVPPYAEAPADLESTRAAAAEILVRLESAKAPALLLCVEVRRYGLEQKVSELARRLAIPTATTFMARGILAGSGAPLIGTYLGLAGDAKIRETIEGSDALLMLGVILCDTNFGVSDKLIDRGHSVLAFDRSVRIGQDIYPDVPLPALVDELLEIAKPLGKAEPSFKPNPHFS
jgi:indolepyruvate decarboxylase